MAVDYKLIGERIKAARKRTAKTQERLAEELSVTIGYVSQIERGITKPNLEMLAELSRLLDCDLTYLIAGVATHEPDYLNSEINKKIDILGSDEKTLLLDIIDSIVKYKNE